MVETLADADAVLVIDETGFLKQGRASCGVARQYTGSAGKITDCQTGVFAAYASRHGHAFIDRAFHLPKSWTDDPARLAATHVPGAVAFATKPRLAVQMIRRAIAASVPFQWVAADSVYGVGEVEQVLRRAGKGYVLGVSSAHRFNSWARTPRVGGTARAIATACEPGDWQRLSAGAGTKGARLHDWCFLKLADPAGGHDRQPDDALWTRGVLIGRHIGNPALLKVVARAHCWFEDLMQGRATSAKELAQGLGVNVRYVQRLLRLAMLAPSIVEAIAGGRHDAGLTIDGLAERGALPLRWNEQVELLRG